MNAFFCWLRSLWYCTQQFPLSHLWFLLEGTFNKVLLGNDASGRRATWPQQTVRRAVPHRCPAVHQLVQAGLALDLRGAHRRPRPKDIPAPGWEHGPADWIQGARQLLRYWLPFGVGGGGQRGEMVHGWDRDVKMPYNWQGRMRADGFLGLVISLTSDLY